MTFFFDFLPLPRKMIQFDDCAYFSNWVAKNHQLVTRFRCLKNTSDVVGPKGAKKSRGFGVLIIIAREVNDFESRPTQEI